MTDGLYEMLMEDHKWARGKQFILLTTIRFLFCFEWFLIKSFNFFPLFPLSKQAFSLVLFFSVPKQFQLTRLICSLVWLCSSNSTISGIYQVWALNEKLKHNFFDHFNKASMDFNSLLLKISRKEII